VAGKRVAQLEDARAKAHAALVAARNAPSTLESRKAALLDELSAAEARRCSRRRGAHLLNGNSRTIHLARWAGWSGVLRPGRAHRERHQPQGHHASQQAVPYHV